MATGPEIKAAREARNLSQRELADMVGMSQPALKKVEDGDTLKSRFMADLAKALGLPAEGFNPPPQFFGPRDLKVYAAAEGGPGEMVVSNQPIDIVARPWYLGEVKEGYAVLVTGDSMLPAFRPGDLAIINPALPPQRGEDMIFVSGEERGEFTATIKHLHRWTSALWHVEQFNPPEDSPREFTLDRTVWTKALRVVGSYRR